MKTSETFDDLWKNRGKYTELADLCLKLWFFWLWGRTQLEPKTANPNNDLRLPDKVLPLRPESLIFLFSESSWSLPREELNVTIQIVFLHFNTSDYNFCLFYCLYVLLATNKMFFLWLNPCACPESTIY